MPGKSPFYVFSIFLHYPSNQLPYSGMCITNPTCRSGSQDTYQVLRQAEGNGGGGGLEGSSWVRCPPLRVEPAWVPAFYKIHQPQQFLPIPIFHKCLLVLPSNACGPTADHATCASNLENTPEPVLECGQLSLAKFSSKTMKGGTLIPPLPPPLLR